MKNAMDAEQSSERVLEITPFIPLILRGKLLENLLYTWEETNGKKKCQF